MARLGRAIVRAAAASAGPEAVSSMLFPSAWRTGPRLGAPQMLQAYSTMPWLRAFTQKIAEDVAGITWQVFVPTDTSGRAIRDLALQRAQTPRARKQLMGRYVKENRLRELPTHPVLDMLSAGNSWFPGSVGFALTQTHLDLVGEMAWLMETNGFMPVSHVPIPPTWVVALPKDNNGFYRIMGPTATWDVPEKNVLWGYHPDPANPFSRGAGIAQVLSDELETDEYAAKYTKDWFLNRAIPPVLISGLGVKLDELNRLEEKWLAKFSRKGAGWLPHFLGKDVQVHQLSQTFEQQQLGSLRERERDTIRQVFGIPPEIMGDPKDSNRATIETADFIYQSRVIQPRAEFLRAVFQERLLKLFNDDRLVIDYVSTVADDREHNLKVMQAASWAWDVDEWRSAGGSDALQAGRGKVHMLPFNMVPTRLGVDVPAGPPALPPTTAPEVGPPRQLLVTGRKAVGRANIDAIVAAAKPAPLSTRGQRVIRETVDAFGQEQVDALQGTPQRAVPPPVAFDLQDPRVIEHLRHWSSERITGKVNKATKDEIRNALADGIEAGDNLDGLTARIRDVFSRASQSRAETIARTEVTRSSNFGAFEGMRQSGVDEKEWLATKDDLTRDAHMALDGVVVGIDETFESEGAQAMYPGEFGVAGLDINCRCGVLPVVNLAEVASLDAVTRTAKWKATEAARAPYMRKLAAAMRDGFAEQERAVLAALTAAGDKAQPRREAMTA